MGLNSTLFRAITLFRGWIFVHSEMIHLLMNRSAIEFLGIEISQVVFDVYVWLWSVHKFGQTHLLHKIKHIDS